MSEVNMVGKRMPRVDAEEKARGQAIFGADVQLPGELVAKLLLSPYAHAEILSIDTSLAEALPGVRAVTTALDIPEVPSYDPASRLYAFFARRYVVFAGQAVAAVAADDSLIAEEAVKLIRVEYRVLPVASSIEAALAPDAPLVAHSQQQIAWTSGGGHTAAAHTGTPSGGDDDDAPSNVVQKVNYRYGDVDAALASSDTVVSQVYRVPVVHQSYIEPHAVVAHWDKPDHVTVWESVQGAFAARDLIANTLGIPQTSITLNATEIGGGFGGKVEGLFAPIAVLLARKSRRPVKLVLTRAEEFWGADPGPETVIKIKTGARHDGTLTAIDAEIYFDSGSFPTGWIMVAVTQGLRNLYRFETWRLRGVEVLTHKASAAAYRAPGGPNVSFAIESQIDQIAQVLDIDPVQLRLQNLVQEGDLLATLEPQVRVGTREVLEALLDRGAWSKEAPIGQNSDRWLYGRGMALGGWEGANGSASAIAVLEADGRIRIILGTVDLTGSFTAMAQIAAQALGVDVSRIVMSKANTDFAPFAPMSAGSQTVYAMGTAVLAAANDLRRRILAHVAKDKAVSVEQLRIDDNGIYLVDDPKSRVSFKTLFLLGTDWSATGAPLVGMGATDKRQRAPVAAASVAEVAVDRETGVVRLLKLVTAQDVGKAINPSLVSGQIQGGSAQSVGFALWEELLYDDQGRVRNPSFLDYRLPTSADMPMIETIIVEVPGGDGPYGAKIVGEPSIIPPVAAIANAIASATGARICELPMRPERIWRTMQQGLPAETTA